MRARAGLTLKQYAERCGIHPSALDKWRRNGWLIKHPDGSVDADASDAARAANGSAIRGGKRVKGQRVRRDEPGDSQIAADEVLDPATVELAKLSVAELERRLLAARVRKTEADAATAEMERDKAAALLLPASDLQPVWTEILVVLRQQVMNYGPRYASELFAIGAANRDNPDEGERLIRKTLDDAGRQVLSEVPDEFKRRMG